MARKKIEVEVKPNTEIVTPKKKDPRIPRLNKWNKTADINDRMLFLYGEEWYKIQNSSGQSKIFRTPEELWNAACNYFEWVDNNPFYMEDFVKSGNHAGKKVDLSKPRPYTIKHLCRFLGCNSKYLNEFESELKAKTDLLSKDFMTVITQIREIIEDQKFQGAAVGFFNANIIARDLGLTDKTEQKHSIDETVVETFKIGDKTITFGNSLR